MQPIFKIQNSCHFIKLITNIVCLLVNKLQVKTYKNNKFTSICFFCGSPFLFLPTPCPINITGLIRG